MLQTEKSSITTTRVRPEDDRKEGAAGLTRAEWLVPMALAIIQFTHVVDFMIVMPLGPELKQALHLGPKQFSEIVAVYGFSASVAGLCAARFMDRFDRKTAVLVLY